MISVGDWVYYHYTTCNCGAEGLEAGFVKVYDILTHYSLRDDPYNWHKRECFYLAVVEIL